MEFSFLKLLRGDTKIRNYLGLKMDPGTDLVQGEEYMYIALPVRGAVVDGELTMLIKRNQHVFLESNGTVDIRGRAFFEVEPNPALCELGQVQGIYRIHPKSGEQRLGLWFTARKDLDLNSLDFLLKVYMPS